MQLRSMSLPISRLAEYPLERIDGADLDRTNLFVTILHIQQNFCNLEQMLSILQKYKTTCTHNTHAHEKK